MQTVPRRTTLKLLNFERTKMNKLLKNTVDELQEMSAYLNDSAKFKSAMHGDSDVGNEIREQSAYLLTAANFIKEREAEARLSGNELESILKNTSPDAVLACTVKGDIGTGTVEVFHSEKDADEWLMDKGVLIDEPPDNLYMPYLKQKLYSLQSISLALDDKVSA